MFECKNRTFNAFPPATRAGQTETKARSAAGSADSQGQEQIKPLYVGLDIELLVALVMSDVISAPAKRHA